jgi:hypothetical protein
MIWLTWRQFRVQAALMSAALAVLAVILAVTGVQLADLADTSGSSFLEQVAGGGTDATVYFVGSAAVLALPAIIGMFWGAPLVARELEAGTHRLVWNQTITRSRWLATKLGVTGLAAIAATGLLTLVVTWWAGPIDDAIASGQAADGIFNPSRVSPWMFVARGIAPIGYAAFALALGVTAGLVLRRTVPAMAVTLAVFVAVQIAVPMVRANLGPAELTTTITASNLRGLMINGPEPDSPVEEITVSIDSPGAWIIANETVDAGGKLADTLPSWVADCGGPPAAERVQARQAACFSRLADAGYQQRVTYQPASRYWTLQAYETAGFIALALLLIGFSFWWLRHRLY